MKVASDGSFSYHTPKRNSSGDLLYDGSGQLQTTQLYSIANIVETEEFKEELNFFKGKLVNNEIVSGLHDKRMAADLNLINLNVDKLKDLVHGDDANDWGGGSDQAPSK